jgi:NADPH:quinone reductase-like Zn-dependent oxidoreductase
VKVRALVISDGGVFWDERPPPVPGPDELLVRVEAAGINRADLLQRAGLYPPPPGLPLDQPGMECAGVVEEVGDRVRTFAPGDRVMGLLGGAAQAELALLHERLTLPVPPAMSMAEAGGFPEVFYTAYDALFSQAGLAMGERLLVTGAAGGVGMAGIQLGLCAGASVVASARDSGVHDRLTALGATSAGPVDAFGLGPFDVVLELVGGDSLPRALAGLAPRGRVVVIGTGDGSRCELDMSRLMSRRAKIMGSTLRARPLEDKALVTIAVKHHVLPFVDQGRVKVVVEAAFPFEQAQEAYERFAAGGKFGKIVLTRS